MSTTNSNKKIIAIDFDGTIVEDAYPAIGALKPFAKEAINMLCNECDAYVIINSCRKGDLLIDMINFLTEKGICFDRVNDNAPWLIEQHGNTRKVHADIFIDANNIGGMPDWKDIPFIFKTDLLF